MISQGLLEELRVILKEDCGKDLPPDQVFEIGNTLVNFFDLLAKFSKPQEKDDSNNGNKN